MTAYFAVKAIYTMRFHLFFKSGRLFTFTTALNFLPIWTQLETTETNAVMHIIIMILVVNQ